MNFEAAKAELAADVVEPLAIAFGQFPLRALLQPADCNDDEGTHAGGIPGATGLPPTCVNQSLARRPMRAMRRTRSADSPAATQIAFAAVGPCVHNLSRL